MSQRVTLAYQARSAGRIAAAVLVLLVGLVLGTTAIAASAELNAASGIAALVCYALGLTGAHFLLRPTAAARTTEPEEWRRQLVRAVRVPLGFAALVQALMLATAPMQWRELISYLPLAAVFTVTIAAGILATRSPRVAYWLLQLLALYAVFALGRAIWLFFGGGAKGAGPAVALSFVIAMSAMGALLGAWWSGRHLDCLSLESARTST